MDLEKIQKTLNLGTKFIPVQKHVGITAKKPKTKMAITPTKEDLWRDIKLHETFKDKEKEQKHEFDPRFHTKNRYERYTPKDMYHEEIFALKEEIGRGIQAGFRKPRQTKRQCEKE